MAWQDAFHRQDQFQLLAIKLEDSYQAQAAFGILVACWAAS